MTEVLDLTNRLEGDLPGMLEEHKGISTALIRLDPLLDEDSENPDGRCQYGWRDGVYPPRPAETHYDTLDGPAVAGVKVALAQGDITPVLKWISADDEKAVRAAFTRTLAVCKQGPEAWGNWPTDTSSKPWFAFTVRVKGRLTPA